MLISVIIGFLIFNLVFTFFFALFIYNQARCFYDPCIFKDSKGQPINLHKVYYPFCAKDELKFYKLWFGGFFCFPIKLIFSFFIAVTMKFHLQFLLFLYKKTDTDPEQHKKMAFAISFWAKAFLKYNGIRIKKRKVDYVKIYKKYLGEDYDFSDDKYSLLISNHIGFFEVVYFMAYHSAGFIAKKEVANYYFVGPIATAMHCLYVDRENENSRKMIFDQLEKRQKGFYKGEYLPNLALFPEGTATTGRHILKFKRGSFVALLPVKPSIVNIDQNSNYHISIGVADVVLSYIKNMVHSFANLYVTDMPTIKPTEFMYEKYKHLGKEKWEIYAEVVRYIMAEVGGLEPSNMRLRDLKRYYKALRYKKYDPNENVDDVNYFTKQDTDKNKEKNKKE